jgi:hypothetical protein
MEEALRGGPQWAVLQLVGDGLSASDALYACSLDTPNTMTEFLFADAAHDLVADGPGKQAVLARHLQDAQLPAEKVDAIAARLGLNDSGRDKLESFSIQEFGRHVLSIDDSVDHAMTTLGVSDRSRGRLEQLRQQIRLANAASATT